jgi:hypothetical protein
VRVRTNSLAIVLAALVVVSTGAARAELLETLEGDVRGLAPPASLAEPGASAGSFLLMSVGARRDLRDAPGALLLFTDGGFLLAMADDDARHFAPWRRDPESGRPLRRDAPDGSRCATGTESDCWRPGDPVPYSTNVAGALGMSLPLHAGSAATPATNFLTGTPVPLVPLNQDPCDAFSSNHPSGCTNILPRTSSTFFGGGGRSTLNEVLTDEQEALLGCGPFYGTDCEADGIDLLNVEASVLMQSMVGIEGIYSDAYFAQNFSGWMYGNGLAQPGTTGFRGTPVAIHNDGGRILQVAGSRGPGDVGYDPTQDGSIAFVGPKFGQCAGATQLSIPCIDLSGVPLQGGGYGDTTGPVFRSEMAVLSFNMQALLVAFSAPSVPSGSIERTELDASNPFSRAPGQCSFAQPQYCASNRAFFSLSVLESNGRRRWLWEAGAEYRVVDAFGDVGDYAGGVVHVLGVEASRTREASLGVPIAIFPPAGSTLDANTRFAVAKAGDVAPSFGFAYLSAPEPSGAALAIAAIAALAAIDRRRSR